MNITARWSDAYKGWRFRYLYFNRVFGDARVLIEARSKYGRRMEFYVSLDAYWNEFMMSVIIENFVNTKRKRIKRGRKQRR